MLLKFLILPNNIESALNTVKQYLSYFIFRFDLLSSNNLHNCYCQMPSDHFTKLKPYNCHWLNLLLYTVQM